jgi:hypothetical protein
MPSIPNFREALSEVIKASWFTLEPGIYVYCRVPEVFHPEKHLMIVRDGHEITVVTHEENLSLLGSYESNKEKWRILNIRCGNPFYCPGFIATITTGMAEEGIDIVITSSFSNDLIMVMDKDLDQAIEILGKMGFEKK